MRTLPLHLLPLLGTLALSACTSESRDRFWRTIDPAGYKHSHSESFNPGKYRRDMAEDPSPEALEMARQL